jgi:light-regulated signal transduction histidine kinase (bacteriophytochrome)
VPVEYTSTPICDAGEIQGAVVVFRDISERKQIEAQRESLLKKVHDSNQELEQFAYVASHDLQEPLRMVSSYTQLLERRYANKLDEDANDFIYFAVDGANRMQRLIQDLLEYSRITTRGKEFLEVDAHLVLKQAINNLQMKIESNGAIITNGELPKIKADEHQLVRVFQNLIDNAIKFKGREFPTVYVGCELRDNSQVFIIKDNGIGIDPCYKEKIFQIFQRLSSREEYPGTGIGLSICKRIIERHGGKIWMESEPGKGTAFFFTINKQKGK